MPYSYEITPRPAELGSGWRLRLLQNGEEMGGGVFPAVRTGYQSQAEAMETAFSQALQEANTWLDSRGA